MHPLISGQGVIRPMFFAQSYHSSWEFWVYNVIWGLFQAPYFSFSQTVMADLCPPGFDFMVCATLRSIYI
jgi:MFS-type transporter involved in bile tolerance (Atg22 family)